METGAFSLFGYLFDLRYDHILQYRVLLDEQKYKVIKGKLNHVMQDFPDHVLSYVSDDLGDALRFIIQDLRSIEIDNGTYPTLDKGDLPITYLPIVAAIEHGINSGYLPSVNFFGQAKKYKDPIGVQKFLDTFGYGDVRTRVPEVYVLADYITEED